MSLVPMSTPDGRQALDYARVRAYSSRRPAVITLEPPAFVVFVGPHAEFIEGRQVLVTIMPDGRELLPG